MHDGGCRHLGFQKLEVISLLHDLEHINVIIKCTVGGCVHVGLQKTDAIFFTI